MVAGRKAIVDAPPVVPARFGLLDTATVLDLTDAETRNGVRFQPDACGAATSYGDACPPVEDRGKVVERGIPEVGAESFVVYAGINCTPVGNAPAALAGRARSALTLGEGRAIEHAFWTGSLDNGETLRPRLAEDGTPVDGDPEGDRLGPTAETITVDEVGVGLGIGLLEQAVGWCYGGRPVLHMDPAVAAIAAANGYLARDGAHLVTSLGSLVSVGRGYPGSGPGVDDAGIETGRNRWVYATGSVVVRRHPIEAIPPVLDRAVNDLVVLAERTVSVSWDCCLFAVEVDLTNVLGGLSS